MRGGSAQEARQGRPSTACKAGAQDKLVAGAEAVVERFVRRAGGGGEGGVCSPEAGERAVPHRDPIVIPDLIPDPGGKGPELVSLRSRLPPG